MTDGTLRVVSTAPVMMTVGRDTVRAILSWPVDHIGWRLQVQTNSLSRTNSLNLSSSTATNQMAFTLDPTVASVFYRLIYP